MARMRLIVDLKRPGDALRIRLEQLARDPRAAVRAIARKTLQKLSDG